MVNQIYIIGDFPLVEDQDFSLIQTKCILLL